MQFFRLVPAAALVFGCYGNEPASPTGPNNPGPVTTPVTQSAAPVDVGSAAGSADTSAPVPASSSAASAVSPDSRAGRDFLAEAKALLVVGACGEGVVPQGIAANELAAHCAAVLKVQSDYKQRWVERARAFFAERVPGDIPKRVVYPFAGGDLSTALTVYPDADEITNISLEPAGDPRPIDVLRGKDLRKALEKVAYELRFLYRVNFSNTLNMIEAMRGGALPTELIFALSALKIHGFEVVSLRYFVVDVDGTLRYLTDDDVAKAPPATEARPLVRNAIFANAELQFRRPGGRTQIYRHIRQNLGDADGKGIGAGLRSDPRVLRHLEAKGKVAAMTKAASYLLSWQSFSLIRGYLTSNAQWMVSDATGVAPKWGRPAGYDYETYGAFVGPHISAGNDIAGNWRAEWKAQPKRKLKFRFGYPDKSRNNHLVIMRKKA